ncbi:hypothetical protein RhiJN_05675 [Ceratobasidium sp. AG-Ba]|nr:hypothetical protein RhiJN_05675 [Ceratobasidium sp. AG-Ba]QRW06605.1 hypothetical protein RhiLY_05604 [Ceratobasidium sp. AG-Ba]
MPDLLFVNDLPYNVLVALYMVTRPEREHKLLATKDVEAFGRVRFKRRTAVPVGARFYITFHNDMDEVLRVEAFLNKNRVTDTHVQSTGTTRLEGFIV